MVFWQLVHSEAGKDFMAPGVLNTLPIARAISDFRHPVCRRSSVILTRHAEQRGLPRYSPRRRAPTSRRTKSSGAFCILGGVSSGFAFIFGGSVRRQHPWDWPEPQSLESIY